MFWLAKAYRYTEENNGIQDQRSCGKFLALDLACSLSLPTIFLSPVDTPFETELTQFSENLTQVQ